MKAEDASEAHRAGQIGANKPPPETRLQARHAQTRRGSPALVGCGTNVMTRAGENGTAGVGAVLARGAIAAAAMRARTGQGRDRLPSCPHPVWSSIQSATG